MGIIVIVCLNATAILQLFSRLLNVSHFPPHPKIKTLSSLF